ncbi:unnamed protein product, partial [Laminaria digitata]
LRLFRCFGATAAASFHVCHLNSSRRWQFVQGGKLCTHRSMATASGGALRTKLFTATWPAFSTDTNAYGGGTRVGRRDTGNQ